MKRSIVVALVLSVVMLPVSGCKSSNDGSLLGTGIGAAGGAVLGGVIGHQSGNKWRGALIGGLIGGLAGYIVGTELGSSSDEPPANTTQYNDAKQVFDQANREEDPQRAIAMYDEVIAIDPSYPEPHNNKGLRYLQLGDEQAAERCFNDALRADPGYQPARDNLAQLG